MGGWPFEKLVSECIGKHQACMQGVKMNGFVSKKYKGHPVAFKCCRKQTVATNGGWQVTSQ